MSEYENLLKYIEVSGKNTLSFVLDDDTVNIYGQIYNNVNILKMKVLSSVEFDTYEEFMELVKEDPNFEVSISHIGDVTPLDVNVITRLKHITIFDKDCDYLDIIEDKMTPLSKKYEPVNYYDEDGNLLYVLELEKLWFENNVMYNLDVIDCNESVLIKLIYGDVYTNFIKVNFDIPSEIVAFNIHKSKNGKCERGNLVYDASPECVGFYNSQRPKYIINILELLNESNIRLTFNL